MWWRGGGVQAWVVLAVVASCVSGVDAGEVPLPTFEDLFHTIVFVTAVWVGGKASAIVGVPSVVAEIVVGIVLGPPLLDFAPRPAALVLYGEIGLLLLVMEAGLEVDVDMLAIIGARGVVVALIGSLLPLAIAFGLGVALGIDTKGAMAVGFGLAPTSMGVAINVLKAGKVLNTPNGQLIIAAAILKDVIALILLTELDNFDDPTPSRILVPIVSSAAMLVVVGLFAVKAAPRLINDVLLPRVPKQQHENVVLAVLFSTSLALMPLANAVKSSHFLGVFLAGLCFCTNSVVDKVWKRQVKRVMQWLLRIFFAASIGFEVPVKQLFTPTVLGRGAVFLVALLGKVATSFFATPLTLESALTVGFSMSMWGEFAFIIATTAKSKKLLDSDTFSALILAALVSVIVSPLLLRRVLDHYRTRAESAIAEAKHDTDQHDSKAHPVYFCLQSLSVPHWGDQDRLMRLFMQQHLTIIDMRSHHPPHSVHAKIVFEAYLKDTVLRAPTVAKDENLLRKIKRKEVLLAKKVKEVLKDPVAKVHVGRWLPGIRHVGVSATEMDHLAFQESSQRLQQSSQILLAAPPQDVEEGPEPQPERHSDPNASEHPNASEPSNAPEHSDANEVPELSHQAAKEYRHYLSHADNEHVHDCHMSRMFEDLTGTHHELDGFVHTDPHDAFPLELVMGVVGEQPLENRPSRAVSSAMQGEIERVDSDDDDFLSLGTASPGRSPGVATNLRRDNSDIPALEMHTKAKRSRLFRFP